MNRSGPNYYLRNLGDYDLKKWADYEKRNVMQENIVFFSSDPSCQQLSTNERVVFGLASTQRLKVTLGDKLLFKYFLNDECSCFSMPSEFTKTTEDHYNIPVRNMTHFNLSVPLVSTGLLFRQAVSSRK